MYVFSTALIIASGRRFCEENVESTKIFSHVPSYAILFSVLTALFKFVVYILYLISEVGRCHWKYCKMADTVSCDNWEVEAWEKSTS
jgi:hypothetical protein